MYEDLVARDALSKTIELMANGLEQLQAQFAVESFINSYMLAALAQIAPMATRGLAEQVRNLPAMEGQDPAWFDEYLQRRLKAIEEAVAAGQKSRA